MSGLPPGLSSEPFCYVTTCGRRSGHPHEIEIWFAANGRTLYILSGGRDRSDWVRNIIAQPEVSVRMGGVTLAARGRIVTEAAEDALARRIVVAKYQPTYGEDLTQWGETSLPVALDACIAESAAGPG